MLLRIRQPLNGSEVDLTPGLTIGRDGCAVLLPDPEVSRRHAVVRRSTAGMALADLGSLNGTWVNHRRIDDVTELHAGDTVRFGNTICSVQAAANAPRPAAP